MSNTDHTQNHTVQTVENNNSPRTLASVYLKGIAMGMADIVPGVSGGTIALIAGIYHRLINALSSVDPQLVSLWKQHGLVKGFIKVWQRVDATFLLCLLLGIMTSIATLAGTISQLLTDEPLKIWSLFFGLIVATIFVLLKDIKYWNWQRIGLFIIGMVVAAASSYASMHNMTFATGSPNLIYLFFAGSLAICATILPGVSGSFLLLLLGVYQPVLDAIYTRDFGTIAVIMAGMLTGLLVFSKFLKWLLEHHYQATLTLLIGFIAGSLIKVYPWKVEIEGIMHNVLPTNYPTGAQWGSSLLLMLIGAVLVIGISWIGKRQTD